MSLRMQQQQQLNQSHSFTPGMNEWPHSVRKKCMLACCRALLVAFCHREKCCRTSFPVFKIKKKLKAAVNVTPFCLPDQRVASFCTMTDMQRAEALQISKELTKRVVEAEGAALDSE